MSQQQSSDTYVRLKPLNARRGHTMAVYVHAPTGKKFEERRGWYKVGSELADYLRTVRQDESDEDSPSAFDVATKAGAKAIDDRERVESVRRAPADQANDLSTSDLGSGRRRVEFAEEPHATVVQPPPAAPSRERRGAPRVNSERSMRPV